MAEVGVHVGAREAVVDACHLCHLAWFDGDEHDVLPAAPPPPPRERPSPAVAELDVRMRAQRERDALVVEVDPWSSDGVAHELGIPILEGEEPGRPWATWAVAAACLVATLVGAAVARVRVDGETTRGLHALALLWGFVPADPWRAGGSTLLTSFFAHASALHLMGNAYFLVVVGARVEGRVGALRFLGLLALGSVAACLADVALRAGSDVPLVGASGGISALFGWYAVTWPRDRLGIVVGGFRRARDLSEVGWGYTLRRLYRVRLPVLVAFGAWVALEWMATGARTNVAHHAHLGGAVAGAGAALLVRVRERAEPRTER
jgi:membrane associated rhomboid family serine protease